MQRFADQAAKFEKAAEDLEVLLEEYITSPDDLDLKRSDIDNIRLAREALEVAADARRMDARRAARRYMKENKLK